MKDRTLAIRILALNTLAFTVCFAVWTMYGVLGAYLADNQIMPISKSELGWLLGIPILTGSIMRLPVGLLTDRYGGKPVYVAVMLLAALGVVTVSFAQNFTHLMLSGLLFGMSGAAFAVGIAYTSVFWPKEKQGTALGIFGVGNAGSAVTTLLAPTGLKMLTNGGANPEGWRQLPLYYAAALVIMTVIFALLTKNRVPEHSGSKTLADMLRPLRSVRVWRFGVYYFLVFGAFVALAQWLVPYYLSVYGMSLAMAGLMASIFSLPSGLIRALGGWASDKFGARRTMYWVLSSCAILFALVIAPRMDIVSPGESVLADRGGVVTKVEANEIVVGDRPYALKTSTSGAGSQTIGAKGSSLSEGNLIWPKTESWQEPAVQVGQEVKKKEVLARGVTHVYFQANVWVFTVIVFLAGIMMGVGKAAVYRHIPDYFPNDVGVVGGIVGVIGGLGGFFCPILFGYLLKATGLWTSCWLFLAVLSVICLLWMHTTIMKMTAGLPKTE
ncbi:MAG TPA: MFS transporter [Fimbriimonadaceae bacterium]|nr:MFS transporter [Fimbriimonadaceae bacterium]